MVTRMMINGRHFYPVRKDSGVTLGPPLGGIAAGPSRETLFINAPVLSSPLARPLNLINSLPTSNKCSSNKNWKRLKKGIVF